jgi:hypothetical protein
VGRELLKLLTAARLGQCAVPDVVVELETRIVDPDRVIQQGDPLELLPIAGNQVEHRFGGALDAADIDSALLGAQRAGLVDQRGGHVHVDLGPLHQEEHVVLGGQPLVAVVGHLVLQALFGSGVGGCDAEPRWAAGDDASGCWCWERERSAEPGRLAGASRRTGE